MKLNSKKATTAKKTESEVKPAPVKRASAVQGDGVKSGRKPAPPTASRLKKADRPAVDGPAQPKPTAETPATVRSNPTMVEAAIDVGFGNVLFIRGAGDGLSWNKGVPLTCVDGGRWMWSTEKAEGRIVFKLLLNDSVWSLGDNVEVKAGERISTVPSF